MSISKFNQECLDKYTYYIKSQMNKEYEEYKCENTLINYTSDVKQFLLYIRDKKCTQAEYEDANEWLNSLKGRHGNEVKPKTRNRKISSLNSFYNMLLDFNIDGIMFNPFKNIPLSKISKRVVEQKEILEMDEIKKLKKLLQHEVDNSKQLKNVPEDTRKILALRNRAIFNLMIATGMRVGEVCNLELSELLVEDGINEVFIPFDKAKGKENRTVTINNEVYRYIIEYRNSLTYKPINDLVFLTKNGKKLDEGSIRSKLMEYIECCGIDKHITCHGTRHTYASHMINIEGMSSEAIAESLGHKNTKLLRETYFHKTKETRKKTVFNF